MEDVLIKREIDKTKKYIEISNYSKEDIIKFLEAKIELSKQINDEIALMASKKMLEELVK
jgi:hypothetical protein